MIYGQVLDSYDKVEMQGQKHIFALGALNTRHLNLIDRAIAYIFEEIKTINTAFNENKSPFQVNVKYICGDTPAMQGIGGFVESVGNANHPCRECEIHKKDIGNIRLIDFMKILKLKFSLRKIVKEEPLKP